MPKKTTPSQNYVKGEQRLKQTPPTPPKIKRGVYKPINVQKPLHRRKKRGDTNA